MVMFAIISLATALGSPPDTLDVERYLIHLDESDERYEELVERLEELGRRPIDLNTCSADDLMELPFVSPAEASAVTAHRHVHGPFTSLETLREVRGLDAATTVRLLPFVTVRPPPSVRSRPPLRADLIQRWTRKLEEADGFQRDSSGYAGGPNGLQTRISVRYGRISARATFDKDAGEPMQWDALRGSFGYDFMSGHVQVEDLGWIRRIVVGDYSPRIAHGVLLRAPGSIRSGSPAGRGGSAAVRPYASASESGYFRGAGIDLAPSNRLSLTVFASRRRADAGIDSTVAGDIPIVSRRPSGLHRTPTERLARGALLESVAGGAVMVMVGPVSIAAAHLTLSETIRPVLATPATRSRRLSAYSLSAGATFGPIYAAVEFAPAAGVSIVADVRSGRHSRFGVALRRAPQANFLPTSAFAAGSDGLTDEVTEVAFHGRHRLSSRTQLDYSLAHTIESTPSDRRSFSAIRSSLDVLLAHTPAPWLTLTIRGTERRSDDADFCANGAVRCLSPATRRTLRFQLDYQHSRHLDARIRGEMVHAASSTSGTARREISRGILIYEELKIRPTDALQIVGRIALFSADQHPARIYVYESDLMYAFSSPSFTGRGRRAYALVRWKSKRGITFEGKWSRTILEDVTSIGTGRDEIDGNQTTEIRMQIRLSV